MVILRIFSNKYVPHRQNGGGRYLAVKGITEIAIKSLMSETGVRLFMYQKQTAVESPAKVDTFTLPHLQVSAAKTMSELVPTFLRHAQYDACLSVQTVQKYKECLEWVIKDIGNLPVNEIDLAHITILKQKVISRGAKEARIASFVFAVKSFLKYCKEILELQVLDYKKIKSPKLRKREVLFLTSGEIEQFLNSIKVENSWDGKTRRKCVRMDGLKFRVLVEVLLGTGMRISEALSLNRDSINWEKREAKIIGKGNKERTVFFNERSLQWVKYYFEQRTDSEQALFITQRNTRMNRADISKMFRRYTKKAGIEKKITPHILRHTVATTLLFNGCPIGHIKEILGHDRLETTCRYYLGLDKSKAKEAHGQYLKF